jgi:hypothetical protein
VVARCLARPPPSPVGHAVDGRTGSALDNDVAESFNSTLEFELLRDHRFATRERARTAVAGWIDEYNTIRRLRIG